MLSLRRRIYFRPLLPGFIADACTRFLVHPHGEGTTWTWSMIIAQRRQAEREGAAAGAGGGYAGESEGDNGGERGGESGEAVEKAVAGAGVSRRGVSMKEDE